MSSFELSLESGNTEYVGDVIVLEGSEQVTDNLLRELRNLFSGDDPSISDVVENFLGNIDDHIKNDAAKYDQVLVWAINIVREYVKNPSGPGILSDQLDAMMIKNQDRLN